MKHARPLLLAASTLALFISACSQPADIMPTLAPQFGGADDDYGAAVALTTTGHTLVLSEQAGAAYDAYGDQNGFYENALLKRYDSSGKLVSSKTIATQECNWDKADCGSDDLEARGLLTDAKGYSYALLSFTYVVDDSQNIAFHYINKVDASGNVVSRVAVGAGGASFGGDQAANDVIDAAVDKDGNIYVAHRQFDYDYDLAGTYTNLVTKYSTTGTKLWQRPSTVGTPYGVTVSGSGSVYVVGTTGLARYTNSGGLTWSRAADNSKGHLTNAGDIVISGSNVYTRSVKNVRKYDGTGKQLWLKSQGGLNTIVVQDMTGDGSGNVYLSGKYDADSSSNRNMNAMVRKLNSSGSVLWTKTYGTSAYDDAKGVATITGSEIYTTGLTEGSLAHTNKGGEDGYLRKFSSSGGTVWTR